MARRYLIIGTGVSSIATAEALRRYDPTGELLLVGEEPHPFYSRPGLAYFLTGELPEAQLYLPQEQPFVRVQARAMALKPQSHQVSLDNGQTLTYDRLLLATGSVAIRPALPGVELEGVVTLDNLDDSRRLLRLTRQAHRAVVVGGGITALELVEGLRARGLKVNYLLRSDRYWRNVLDSIESRLIETRLQAEGVNLHFQAELAQIMGQSNRVIGVETQAGRRLECELVALAIGVKPRKELAQTAGLRTDRGILVNEFLQTSDPDIFAAGDVAQVFDPLSGTAVLDTLWSTAKAQGQVAGQNMAGVATPYRKQIPFNVTRLAGLTTALIGAVGSGDEGDAPDIVRGDSETWRYLPDCMVAQTQFEVNRLRLMVGPHTLLGAVVMGDQTLTHALHYLIANQVNITPIRDQLLRPESRLADVLADFWTARSSRYEPRI